MIESGGAELRYNQAPAPNNPNCSNRLLLLTHLYSHEIRVSDMAAVVEALLPGR
jgi:hypothetical protein